MDNLFSSEETTLLDVWVDSSLVCDSGRKLLVALESLVLTGKTRWFFLVSWRALQMRTRHVKKSRGIRSSGI